MPARWAQEVDAFEPEFFIVQLGSGRPRVRLLLPAVAAPALRLMHAHVPLRCRRAQRLRSRCCGTLTFRWRTARRLASCSLRVSARALIAGRRPPVALDSHAAQPHWSRSCGSGRRSPSTGGCPTSTCSCSSPSCWTCLCARSLPRSRPRPPHPSLSQTAETLARHAAADSPLDEGAKLILEGLMQSV